MFRLPSAALRSFGVLLALATLCAAVGNTQTFRGAINGTVTDNQGGAIANAAVVAVENDTHATHSSVSSSAGEFSFQDLPLGDYTITVTSSGFATAKYNKIGVQAGATYTLAVKLQISTTAETVEVNR